MTARRLTHTFAAMLLVIDNYDSFTYNLVQYFGELGAEMEVHRNDQITLDEIREAVERLEDTARTARRVLGGACPVTRGIELELNMARAALRARETPPPGSA